MSFLVQLFGPWGIAIFFFLYIFSIPDKDLKKKRY